MKFLLATFFLLLSAQVLALDACMTGSYYDPSAPGEGINVEANDDYVIVYFYDQDGSWMFLQGETGDDLTAYQNLGDYTYNVGKGYFEPIDPRGKRVLFGFDLLLDVRDVSWERPIPWCLRSDCERDFRYIRLTQPIPCE